MAKSRHSPDPLIIQSPRSHERIIGRAYDIRVAACAASRVEVSINGSPWQPCRVGREGWSFPWSGFDPGDYMIRVQACDERGRLLALESRHIQVRPLRPTPAH